MGLQLKDYYTHLKFKFKWPFCILTDNFAIYSCLHAQKTIELQHFKFNHIYIEHSCSRWSKSCGWLLDWLILCSNYGKMILMTISFACCIEFLVKIFDSLFCLFNLHFDTLDFRIFMTTFTFLHYICILNLPLMSESSHI